MWRLTDDQRKRRERIRAFALEEVRPRMLEVDETCDYPFDVHDALRREGLIGLAVPEEYGGAGTNSVGFCSARNSAAVDHGRQWAHRFGILQAPRRSR